MYKKEEQEEQPDAAQLAERRIAQPADDKPQPVKTVAASGRDAAELLLKRKLQDYKSRVPALLDEHKRRNSEQ